MRRGLESLHDHLTSALRLEALLIGGVLLVVFADDLGGDWAFGLGLVQIALCLAVTWAKLRSA